MHMIGQEHNSWLIPSQGSMSKFVGKLPHLTSKHTHVAVTDLAFHECRRTKGSNRIHECHVLIFIHDCFYKSLQGIFSCFASLVEHVVHIAKELLCFQDAFDSFPALPFPIQ